MLVRFWDAKYGAWAGNGFKDDPAQGISKPGPHPENGHLWNIDEQAYL